MLVYAPQFLRRGLSVAVSLAIVIGVGLLGLHLAQNHDTSFPHDAHYGVADRYLLQNNWQYAYSSMNTGLPTTYLFNDNVRLIPLSCLPNQTVEPSQTFFDKSAIVQVLSKSTQDVPLILDLGQLITNVPAVCTQQTIIQQLGNPLRIDNLSDGSHALIYNAQTVRQKLNL